jgi:cobalt/nickel transport system permease protein
LSDFWDRYGRSVSVCHRLPPVLKLVLALSVIVASVAIPVQYWPAYGLLGCVVFAGHSIAGIPFGYVAKRLLLFLPFVGSMAVSLPLSQGFDRGWDLMLQILFRGMLAFLVSLWLVNVMPFEQLLTTLRRLRVPAVLVAILAFMYRYVFVVWDELDSLRVAWRMRSFGGGSLFFRWKTLGQMIGMLLIRSLNRAERIHGAMLSRGWDGEVRWLDDTDR